MYINITPQTLGANFSQSVADFVDYLEKENQGLEQEDMEPFFNQYGDAISSKEVINDIDCNTAKLKKVEPKFYSITVSPSHHELKQLKDSSANLKRYTRELMKDYVTSFNREINNKPITIDDIKYYAGVYMLVPAFFLVNVFVNNLYVEINTNFWGNLFGTDWGSDFFAPLLQFGSIGFIVLLKFKLYRRATSFVFKLFSGG